MARTVTKPNNKSDALTKVFDCIEKKQSFILEAGAGSGKTWSLIESLKYILETHSNYLLTNDKRIVCITYTNVAKDEISERIDHNPLVFAHTIHDFLWNEVNSFQAELRNVLLEYNENESKKPIEHLEEKIADDRVMYSQYGRNFEKARITHDDVITFSSMIFDKYPKILGIVANKYPYIFVDEYQDTEERTVILLLDKLLNSNMGKIVIGFFGDSMQKIYNQGIGSISNKKLETITKEDNFRCSEKVIGLLNKIRTTLVQKPAGKNVEGKISFYHCNNDVDNKNNVEKVIEHLKSKEDWNIDFSKTKVLMLTHKGIADKLDYSNLLEVYSKRPFGRDHLYETDELFIDLLINKIENLFLLYQEKKYGELVKLLGIEGYKVNKHSDKKYLQSLMNELDTLREKETIKEVIDYVFEKRLLNKSYKISEFENTINQAEREEEADKDKEFYESLMDIEYQEVIKINNYIKEYTPFSTKHGVKGAEYENVLVVIDDRSWNQYNFNHVFANNRQNVNRFNRTLNLLYVCCSRTKDKLSLLALSKLDTVSIKTIESWFGQENVFDVANL